MLFSLLDSQMSQYQALLLPPVLITVCLLFLASFMNLTESILLRHLFSSPLISSSPCSLLCFPYTVLVHIAQALSVALNAHVLETLFFVWEVGPSGGDKVMGQGVCS